MDFEDLRRHGLSMFILRYRLRDHDAILCAFDLIALDGKLLRWRPLEHRKAMLAKLVRAVSEASLSTSI